MIRFEIPGYYNSHKTYDLWLDADQPLGLFCTTFPILWKGTLDRKDICISQETISTIDTYFDFKEYPSGSEYVHLKEGIIQAIDKHLVNCGFG